MSTKSKKPGQIDQKGGNDDILEVENFKDQGSKYLDNINIQDQIDISVEIKNNKVDKNAHIRIFGKNVDVSVVNAIRRTIMLYIPAYAYHPNNVKIDNKKTKCMCNNDMIFMAIKNLPIYDVNNFFDLENPELYLPTQVFKTLFPDFVPEKFDKLDNESYTTDGDKKLYNIEIQLNVNNVAQTGFESKDIFLTTHHLLYKVDGKENNTYKNRNPVFIGIVLRENEEISLSATATLGIEKMDVIYSVSETAVLLYDKETDYSYELKYTTHGQITKNAIFEKSCFIIIKKLEKLDEYIATNLESNQYSENKMLELELYGEDETIGKLISTTLQRYKYVKSASSMEPHSHSNRVKIIFELNDLTKDNPIKVLQDVLQYLTQLYKTILNSFLSNIVKNMEPLPKK